MVDGGSIVDKLSTQADSCRFDREVEDYQYLKFSEIRRNC